MTLDPIATHAATFLFGVAVGAAGQYFADKYTDRRRAHEARRREDLVFRKLELQMPDLFSALQKDLREEPTKLMREVFVLPTPGVMLGFANPHFRYNETDIPNLREKVDLLVEAGFMRDITTGNAPHYRLEEDLVERLLEGG